MEENNSTELEEGEACYYQEEEGGNDNIDPDIALSYIVRAWLLLLLIIKMESFVWALAQLGVKEPDEVRLLIVLGSR